MRYGLLIMFTLSVLGVILSLAHIITESPLIGFGIIAILLTTVALIIK